MNLTNQQKRIICESVKFYSQVIKRKQLPPERSEAILLDIQEIISELDLEEETEQRPLNITDEQFENVCRQCDKFTNKCNDMVAKKYPGKCDPILHFEKQKEKINGNSSAN